MAAAAFSSATPEVPFCCCLAPPPWICHKSADESHQFNVFMLTKPRKLIAVQWSGAKLPKFPPLLVGSQHAADSQ